MCMAQNGTALAARQDAMLMTVTGIAKKLLAHTTAQPFDDIVTDCLRMLGEVLGKNRVYIWKDRINAEGRVSCIQIYEWVKDVEPIQGIMEYEDIVYDDLPLFHEALNKGQCLNQRVSLLTASERAILEPQGILTLLIAPISIEGVRWGFIGVDNCESLEVFSQHEENMLLTSGFMLASAILKQATEKDLRQSEELAQAMFDATPLGCSVWNRHFEVITCNEGAVKLFGLESKQDFVEKFRELSPPFQSCGTPSQELVSARIDEAFRTGRNEFEWLHQKIDGEPVPVHVTLVRIRYKNEDAVAGYVRDLRELKAQEEQRREAEERTELMLNAMPLCCNFWDKNFSNIACNDEAVRLFELSSQQEYLERFFEFSPQYQPCGGLSEVLARQKIVQAFSEGYVRFEWLHQRKDGTPIPAEITLIRLMFKNEYFVVGYTRDLREYKAMLAEVQAVQQKLALARDEALAHSRAKSEFLANMSHEIRTPMNGIIGLSYLALQSSDMPQQLREYIEKNDDSAKALLRIINDILDFSKVSAGKLDMEYSAFDLMEMLEHSIHPLIPAITSKGLDLYIDVSRGIPVQLVGDPVRLRQVILNLVTNATKFTHTGHITIRIDKESQTSSGVMLRFTVSDTGVGIGLDYLAQLFEPFTQADTSVTRRYGGTGLGLAICKQIINLMGGTISVSSTLGDGSTFTFTARFGLDDIKGGMPPQSALHGKRVLIVDDNDISRRILTAYVNGSGAIACCVTDERAALAALEEHQQQGTPCHAIVIDGDRFPMSTLEALVAFGKVAVGVKPVIMVTAYDPAAVSLDLQTMGIDTVLTKPLTPPALNNAVRAIAETRGLKTRADDNASVDSKLETSAGQKTSTALVGKHVLLAEDNEINKMIAVELLQGFGMSVEVATTGIEAMDCALAAPFDVILMDIQMPEMDGIEATKRLRAYHPALNATPIIAMTAHAMADDYEKSIMAGMQAHITKPIDPEELHDTLLHWVTNDSWMPKRK